MYFLYTLIYTVVIISLLPFQYFKRPKDIRKRWLREKCGLMNSPRIIYQSSHVWVHAVSVGEVTAAAPLLKRLKEKYPLKGIILSTITDTGQKVARERSPEGSRIVYLPFDIPFILNSILKKVKPEILIIIETELWPNIFRVFRQNNIPIVLLNGRISEKSFRGYRKISFFMRRVLSCANFFGMQNEQYAERIRLLGADSDRVRNIGNFKFDSTPPSKIPRWAAEIKGPVIVAGSTHEGEEELITSVYRELKKDFPDLNLVIAPRHPERFKDVEHMFRSKKVQFFRRSDLEASHPQSGESRGAIVLLDTVGELSSVYGIADIAIIGKSFRGYGGQNPLEPAYWGKPVICGPHMENFPVISEFYGTGAAIEVHEQGLYSALKDLLMVPEKAKEIGSQAGDLYRKYSGAAERAMEIIARYVEGKQNVADR
jgi:3-deoxy-D-manno-octulosonic-acid transferase